jgi:predicted dehydrogenase
MVHKTRIGLVGCGNISTIYLTNCARFENIQVTAVADLDPAHAKAQAAAFDIPHVLTPRELIEGDKADVILNLTVPTAHAQVALQALENGKSVYNEKPIATTRQDAAAMLDLAKKNGLRIGCAPDTFLGASLQNARKLIDQGAIGTPVAAVAFMLCGGAESWHPNPFFFYQKGAGPMFDMGPYYLTALTMLLGPVRRVTGSARISSKQRLIGSQPHKGEFIDVEVPTHVAGLLDFASGPVGTIITTFDVPGKHHLPNIEIYGTAGSMRVTDPNTFGDENILLNAPGEKEWRSIPSPFGYAENSRGIGLADMSRAILSGRPHRANGSVAFHVLDILHAVHESSDSGAHIELTTTMVRPDPLPENLTFGQLPD